MTKGQPTKNCCSKLMGLGKIIIRPSRFLIYTILCNFLLPTIIYSIHAREREVEERAANRTERRKINLMRNETGKIESVFTSTLVYGLPIHWMARMTPGSYHEFYCFRQRRLSVRVKRGAAVLKNGGRPVLLNEFEFTCASYRTPDIVLCSFPPRVVEALKYGVCVIHGFSLLLHITIISCLAVRNESSTNYFKQHEYSRHYMLCITRI